MQEKVDSYEQSQGGYIERINKIFSEFDVDLVVYDEIENFRNSNHDQFNYPFDKRKTKISSYVFDVKPVENQDGNYQIPLEILSFRQSFACLEPSIFADMYFHVMI